MNETLLSVVIPVYNAEKYIEKCLESVRKNIPFAEVIVVNDGSKDNSKTILEKYAKAGDIILIDQKNAGVSAARNNGILQAKGKYITFLDADDLIMNETDISIEDDSDLIIYNYHDIDSDDNIIQKVEVIKNITDVDDVKSEFVLGHKFNACWGKLYKTETIKNNDIFFPTDMKVGEDMHWLSQYLKHTKKVTSYSVFLYGYRQNEEGAMVRLRQSLACDRINEFAREIQIKSAIVDSMEWNDSQKGLFYERFASNIIAKINFAIKSSISTSALLIQSKDFVSDKSVRNILKSAAGSKHVSKKRRVTSFVMICTPLRNAYIKYKRN